MLNCHTIYSVISKTECNMTKDKGSRADIQISKIVPLLLRIFIISETSIGIHLFNLSAIPHHLYMNLYYIISIVFCTYYGIFLIASK